jgi:hypothetical protein
MSKRILTAVLLGLAVASHGVLAQDKGTTGGDQKQAKQKQAKQKGAGSAATSRERTLGYEPNDDAPGYPLNP